MTAWGLGSFRKMFGAERGQEFFQPTEDQPEDRRGEEAEGLENLKDAIGDAQIFAADRIAFLEKEIEMAARFSTDVRMARKRREAEAELERYIKLNDDLNKETDARFVSEAALTVLNDREQYLSGKLADCRRRLDDIGQGMKRRPGDAVMFGPETSAAITAINKEIVELEQDHAIVKASLLQIKQRP